MKTQLAISIVFLSLTSIASATLCETEMKKFVKFSDAERSYVCRDLKSDAMFSIFKDCLFSTAKRFNSKASPEKLYQATEESLSGLISLCSGGMASSKPSEKGAR